MRRSCTSSSRHLFGFRIWRSRSIARWHVVSLVMWPEFDVPQTLTNLRREMAVGNTFGATALSSYGGFWISYAIILTPGGFEIVAAYATKDAATGKATSAGVNDFNNDLGYFLAGWFIFTFILLLCTLRSTVAFFLLF